jgi:hypothetical protein
MQQLQTYLLATAPTPAIRASLTSYLDPSSSSSSASAPASAAAPSSSSSAAGAVSLGLLMHDRVINTPSELLPHFHTALADDIAWAAKNDVLHLTAHFFRPLLSALTSGCLHCAALRFLLVLWLWRDVMTGEQSGVSVHSLFDDYALYHGVWARRSGGRRFEEESEEAQEQYRRRR